MVAPLKIKYKPVLLPPSHKDVGTFCELLQSGAFIETAAAAAFGWNLPMFREALKKGRAREIGFSDFVERMDEVTHNQSYDIWQAILERAKEGDFSAIKYIHSSRIAPREKFINEALLNDELGPAKEDDGFSEADVAAAERRVMDALNKPEPKH